MVKIKKLSKNFAKKTLAVADNKLKALKTGKVSKVVKDTTSKLKEQLVKKEKRKKRLTKLVAERGVVLVRHIPHGFYEKELYGYFKQFGKVTAIKLPRSKDYKSKGFAFVEFEVKEVAKIAADTMNNKIMFDKLVKTEYIPPEKQKPELFHRACFPWKDSSFQELTIVRRELDRTRKNNPKVTGSDFAKKAENKIKKLKKRLLEKTGVSYEFQINDG